MRFKCVTNVFHRRFRSWALCATKTEWTNWHNTHFSGRAVTQHDILLIVNCQLSIKHRARAIRRNRLRLLICFAKIKCVFAVSPKKQTIIWSADRLVESVGLTVYFNISFNRESSRTIEHSKNQFVVLFVNVEKYAAIAWRTSCISLDMNDAETEAVVSVEARTTLNRAQFCSWKKAALMDMC